MCGSDKKEIWMGALRGGCVYCIGNRNSQVPSNAKWLQGLRRLLLKKQDVTWRNMILPKQIFISTLAVPGMWYWKCLHSAISRNNETDTTLHGSYLGNEPLAQYLPVTKRMHKEESPQKLCALGIVVVLTILGDISVNVTPLNAEGIIRTSNKLWRINAEKKWN